MPEEHYSPHKAHKEGKDAANDGIDAVNGKKADENKDSLWRELQKDYGPLVVLGIGIGGFIAIGNVFPDEWNWQSFWTLTALLSVILAIMNILPIPGLDGGHALFTLWEIITRRKPSDKFLEVMQYIGLALLLLLLVYANGNDIIKLFIK